MEEDGQNKHKKEQISTGNEVGRIREKQKSRKLVAT
jgi:hypothetical protein